METPYIMLGASVTCGACKRVVLPKVEDGTPMPNTGYEVTFGNFVHLLTNRDYRFHVMPLLTNWAPAVEQLINVDTKIGPDTAQERSLIEIHRTIQSDSSKQYELYQVAMSLWR